MIELVAAIAGSIIGISGIAAGSMIRKSGSTNEAIITLSIGVKHISEELKALRADMKEDRHEIYGRLGNAEQRLLALETIQKQVITT